MLKTYKDLKVWQKAYLLCLEVYQITQSFPEEEIYGLVPQMRRASVSIVSNIAEGYGRKTKGDYIRMLYISYGSVCELETQLLLSGDLGFVVDERLNSLIEMIREVERMLKGLIRSLERKK
ncbi:MAG: four helix bundle protein [Deltaproteobacteria bacterium]|nr:four helix bundle protein [Candidatus Latescibacterota bacterium]NIS77379.1 four helix bundle protein [Deltaproteobacteria bacterium]